MSFCHDLVPLLCPFDCSRLTCRVTQQVLSKRNSMVHCCSWDVPHKLQDKVLGKNCDILDSVLLIDTFLVLFRSFWGRYTGVDSSSGFVLKKGLPNSLPLPNSCQKPSQVSWQCPFSFALFFGNHMQVAPEDLFKHYVPIIFPKLIERI